MRGLFKTLFGDARTVCVAGVCIGAAGLILVVAPGVAAGMVLPPLLLAGAVYLARH